MFINCAVGALSAIHNKSLGELAHDAELSQVMEAVILEGYRTFESIYTFRPYDEFIEYFYSFLDQVRGHYSSMYQDLRSGRKTENYYLNGLISRVGAERGVPTPVNDMLYEQIREIENSLSIE